MTTKQLNELFYYDETSPSFLRWRVPRYRGKKLTSLFIPADAPAGTLDRGEYWRVNIRSKGLGQVYVHKIVALIHGVVENLDTEIDHIDGDTLNNNFANLRPVTDAQNTQNMKIHCNNTSGATGVHWNKTKDRCNPSIIRHYAMASWREGGKQWGKAFSVETYGLMKAFALAWEYRQRVIAKLNAQGASYTERHGK